MTAVGKRRSNKNDEGFLDLYPMVWRSWALWLGASDKLKVDGGQQKQKDSGWQPRMI